MLARLTMEAAVSCASTALSHVVASVAVLTAMNSPLTASAALYQKRFFSTYSAMTFAAYHWRPALPMQPFPWTELATLVAWTSTAQTIVSIGPTLISRYGHYILTIIRSLSFFKKNFSSHYLCNTSFQRSFTKRWHSHACLSVNTSCLSFIVSGV